MDTATSYYQLPGSFRILNSAGAESNAATAAAQSHFFHVMSTCHHTHYIHLKVARSNHSIQIECFLPPRLSAASYKTMCRGVEVMKKEHFLFF